MLQLLQIYNAENLPKYALPKDFSRIKSNMITYELEKKTINFVIAAIPIKKKF